MYEFKSSDVYEFAEAIGAETKLKGNELFFKYCPHCDGGGHDKETFSVNMETGAFKCFRASCDYHGHFVELARDFNFPLRDDSQKKYKTLPQKKVETRPGAIEYLASRGISERIAKKYKITVRKDRPDILVFPFYDENNIMQFIKYRNTNFNGKGSKEWTEKDTKPILFGMQNCVDRTTLVITEGQIDSLSLSECGVKNAVSVPTGALGFTWLANVWDWINEFEEIIVFGDCEKGHITLIDTLEKRLQKKVKCVREEDYLHEKDANDILRKFGKEAIVKAISNAELREVKYVNRLSNVKPMNLKDRPKIKTGIREFDRLCGGLVLGHLFILSGKCGDGKSTFMSQVVANAINEGNAVFAYSGELPNSDFKNWLDLQVAGSDHIQTSYNEYGDPDYYLDDETSEIINKWYYDKAFVFDNSAIADDEYCGLLKVIVDSICRYDIKLVCIDNLMTAMECDADSDLYRHQSKFVNDLAIMAKQYDVAIILVAHPKKTKEGFTNDSVSGSSDITNAASMVLNYQRMPDNSDYDSFLMVSKNRLNGRKLIGDNIVPLYYSDKSKRITSNLAENIEYSCFKGVAPVENQKVNNIIPF